MEQTTILVEDSIRHYYPLVQGTDLTLIYRLVNTGSTPLVITDIQPSCGCIIENDEQERVVAPGKETMLRFAFSSDKNNGYVHHTIRLFGNIYPQGTATLSFDLNVIQPTLGTPDYEEVYRNREEKDHKQLFEQTMAKERYRRDYWVTKQKNN